MWNYQAPFPRFKLKPMADIPWLANKVYSDVFAGMHSQTGTYLETPAHYWGCEKSYSVADIPLEKIVDVPCTILRPELSENEQAAKRAIGVGQLVAAAADREIEPGDAILVSTGWSRNWNETWFTDASPYFTYEAMMWLISRKPGLLGGDFPCWDSPDQPQGFFDAFFSANILMLAPCDKLWEVKEATAHLTVLPLNIPGTSASPCRAFIREIAGGGKKALLPAD